jgi:hypothetical protein
MVLVNLKRYQQLNMKQTNYGDILVHYKSYTGRLHGHNVHHPTKILNLASVLNTPKFHKFRRKTIKLLWCKINFVSRGGTIVFEVGHKIISRAESPKFFCFLSPPHC